MWRYITPFGRPQLQLVREERERGPGAGGGHLHLPQHLPRARLQGNK